MSHEHSGECCGHHDHAQAETEHRHHHIAERLGSLCCTGACGHPEHMPLAQVALHDMLAAHMLHMQQQEQEEAESSKKSKDKKKKRTVARKELSYTPLFG